jgi:hypothetical protein
VNARFCRTGNLDWIRTSGKQSAKGNGGKKPVAAVSFHDSSFSDPIIFQCKVQAHLSLVRASTIRCCSSTRRTYLKQVFA